MTHPKTVTITLMQDAHGNVRVCTDLPQPAMGAPLSPAQALGLDLITHCRHQRHEVLHGAEHVPALALALDLTSPEMYGWSTAPEVRNRARAVLGIPTLSGSAA